MGGMNRELKFSSTPFVSKSPSMYNFLEDQFIKHRTPIFED